MIWAKGALFKTLPSVSYESVAAPKSIVAVGGFGVSDSLGQALGQAVPTTCLEA